MSDPETPDPIPPHRLVNGVMVPLTAEEIAARAAEEAAWAPPAPRWDVPKLLVVERLGAAGKLREAHVALRLDEPAADLSDAELLLRERWLAAREIASEDAQARGLFAAVGADPDAILARP